MLKFIAKRLANYVVMLFVAISCTYFLASGFMRPRSNYESRTPRPPAASINRSLDLANINDHTNIFTRYWRWLTGVVTRWDWGLSPDLGSVNGALAPRIVASTELVTIATVLSIVLGVRSASTPRSASTSGRTACSAPLPRSSLSSRPPCSLCLS